MVQSSLIGVGLLLGGLLRVSATASCGNGMCEASETHQSCYVDCGRCGDGRCTCQHESTSGIAPPGANRTACPADCRTQHIAWSTAALANLQPQYCASIGDSIRFEYGAVRPMNVKVMHPAVYSSCDFSLSYRPTGAQESETSLLWPNLTTTDEVFLASDFNMSCSKGLKTRLLVSGDPCISAPSYIGSGNMNSCAGRNHAELCALVCAAGYVRDKNQATVKCHHGTWEHGRCLPAIACVNAAPVMTHAVDMSRCQNVEDEANCTFDCQENYMPSKPLHCYQGALSTASCVLMAPCASKPPKVDNAKNMECQNVPSGTVCQMECDEGYTPSANPVCRNGIWTTVECEAKSCMQAPSVENAQLQHCANTPDSQYCSIKCDAGYRKNKQLKCFRGVWVEDGWVTDQVCQDINECQTDNGGCPVGQLCQNLRGSSYCQCNISTLAKNALFPAGSNEQRAMRVTAALEDQDCNNTWPTVENVRKLLALHTNASLSQIHNTTQCCNQQTKELMVVYDIVPVEGEIEPYLLTSKLQSAQALLREEYGVETSIAKEGTAPVSTKKNMFSNMFTFNEQLLIYIVPAAGGLLLLCCCVFCIKGLRKKGKASPDAHWLDKARKERGKDKDLEIPANAEEMFF